jgi:small GTP-binding protein
MKRSYNDMNEDGNNDPVKIVLLGDGCIGKSTFFNKLSKLTDPDYTFQKAYRATDNFDFNRLKIETNQGTQIIDLWDTAGQENRGGKLRDAYLKGADGILLMYDVTEKKTIVNINTWLTQIKRVCPEIPVAVIGNKSDLFGNLQQSESVKIRECNLQREVGHKQIKNFLISIKENTHIETTTTGFFSVKTEIKEVAGCMCGLEYILSMLNQSDVKIKN